MILIRTCRLRSYLHCNEVCMAFLLQAFGAFDFVWNFALPVTIFVCCYSRIFHIIRRHNRRVGDLGAAMATMSRDQEAGDVVQQQAITEGTKFSRTEMNVLQTMMIIIVCFIICWAPTSVANIVQSTTVCFFFHL